MGIVDFAMIGRAAIGDGGALDMADDGQVITQALDWTALAALHVVANKHHFKFDMRGLRYDRGGLAAGVAEFLAEEDMGLRAGGKACHCVNVGGAWIVVA